MENDRKVDKDELEKIEKELMEEDGDETADATVYVDSPYPSDAEDDDDDDDDDEFIVTDRLRNVYLLQFGQIDLG